MNNLWQDIRFGFRMLMKSPASSIVIVLTLALGIGANTAIFSMVNSILLRPMPYQDSDRIMTLLHGGRNPVSPADYLDWKNQQQSFEVMSAAEAWGGTLTGIDQPEALRGLRMGNGMFSLLGVNPLLGRTFTPDDYQAGNENVVILSHSLWQRQFGEDQEIVGKTITLDNQQYTVIGVMPNGFQFPPFWAIGAEMWAPLTLFGRENDRSGNSLRIFAKIKNDVTQEQAQSEMNTICARLEELYPQSNTGRTVQVDTMHEKVVGNIKLSLYVLLGAVGFVLLIACANVANISLVRTAMRQKEMAVRMALGAGRNSIIRLMLAESLLLALIAGVCSILPSVWGIEMLKALIRNIGNSTRSVFLNINDIGIDFTILSLTFFIAVVTGILFGLLPAVRASGVNLNEPLKESGRGMTDSKNSKRLRGSLIVAEVAVSFVLLIGAGLLMQSYLQLQSIDPGYNPKNILSSTVSVAGLPHYVGEPRISFYRQVIQNTEALPGVQSVSAINHLPLHGDLWSRSIIIEGIPLPPPGEQDGAVYRVCMPKYFQTMEIPLLQGRDFTDLDKLDSLPVIIINETLANQYWENEDPIGKRIAVGGSQNNPDWRTIVGVIKDTKQYDWSAESSHEIYLPFLQQVDYLNDTAGYVGYMTLVIRTIIPPLELVSPLQNVVRAINKDIPVSKIVTLEQVVANAVWQERVNMLLIGLFAIVAVLLASIGLYGVISYSVAQRTQEMGVRMALGANQANVLSLIIRQGVRLVAIGVGIGLLASLLLTKVLSSLLYGITPTDPVTYTGVTALLISVSVLACLIPAWRASRINPITALRCE